MYKKGKHSLQCSEKIVLIKILVMMSLFKAFRCLYKPYMCA